MLENSITNLQILHVTRKKTSFPAILDDERLFGQSDFLVLFSLVFLE